jgi:mannose/fructose/N-acetylgalactosamine-specific phosphotransferase system component IIB
MANTETLKTAGQMAHDAADLIHGQLATAGAVEARAMLVILAQMRRAADDLQQLAADIAEDQKA